MCWRFMFCSYLVLQPFLLFAQSVGLGEGQVYIEDPVYINSATGDELRSMLPLSEFQIESLLSYRNSSGAVLGAVELSLLPGFDIEAVALILPLISFDVRDRLSGGGKLKSELFVKSSARVEQDTSLLGSPYDLHLKFKMSYGKHLGAGITLQNDEGEPFMDFVSSNISLKDYGIVKSLVLGDFSVRFAQGLTAWNSFSLASSAAASPTGMLKHGGGISPYTSSDEGNFFRGAGLSLAAGNFSVSAFGSFKRVDARIKDGKYISLPQEGLHNTASTLAARKTMGEFAAGGNVAYLGNRVKVELSGLCYCYDMENGLPVKEYNKYRMYDGLWGNWSLGVYGVFRRGRYFGEMAVDFGGSTAFLGGSVMRFSGGCELGVLVRRYSRSYIATYASAYSSISDVANQNGITASCTCTPLKDLKVTAWADAVFYPWKRYGVDTSSCQLKWSVRSEFARKNWDVSATVTYRYINYNNQHRLYVKGDAGFRLKENGGGGGMLCGIYLKAKWAAVCVGKAPSDSGSDFSAGVPVYALGWMVGFSAKCSFWRERTVLQIGLAWYDCPVWDVRLYNYENDLPYTYNSRLLYGEGGSCYIMLKQKIFRNCYLYLKGDDTKVKLGVRCII